MVRRANYCEFTAFGRRPGPGEDAGSKGARGRRWNRAPSWAEGNISGTRLLNQRGDVPGPSLEDEAGSGAAGAAQRFGVYDSRGVAIAYASSKHNDVFHAAVKARHDALRVQSFSLPGTRVSLADSWRNQAVG
jgi:hypothetical protein